MTGGTFSLYVHGRLRGLSRDRLELLLPRVGGRLLRRPSQKVILVAVAHSTASATLAKGLPVELRFGVARSAEVISELELRRRLGLAALLRPEARRFDEGTLARLARLEPALVRALGLYDVLDDVRGHFGYRDLVSARQVQRLLKEGLSLTEIVRASCVLRRSGKSLADTRLVQNERGEIVQVLGEARAQLEGQFAFHLDEPFETADQMFDFAEEAESNGDQASAEVWYRHALQACRSDPVAPFNMANLVHASGRLDEAVLGYLEALKRDVGFADAWVNLGVVREEQKNLAVARVCYLKALSTRPDCPEALFNLGRMLTLEERYDEALPVWKQYAALGVPDISGRARRMRKLCELAARATAASPSAGIEGKSGPAI